MAGIFNRQKQKPGLPQAMPLEPPAAPEQPATAVEPPAQLPMLATRPGDNPPAPGGFTGVKPENAGGGNAGGGVTPHSAKPSFEKQAADMWSGMMADYDASLGGKMEQTYADEARAARRADAVNAMSGRGVSGGGYDAAAATVALGGIEQRQDVLNEHTKQGLMMKLTYLESLIKRAEAAKDRNLRERLQAEADATLLALQGAGIDTTNYSGSHAPGTKTVYTSGAANWWENIG